MLSSLFSHEFGCRRLGQLSRMPQVGFFHSCLPSTAA